jgi:hypothetical protein
MIDINHYQRYRRERFRKCFFFHATWLDIWKMYTSIFNWSNTYLFRRADTFFDRCIRRRDSSFVLKTRRKWRNRKYIESIFFISSSEWSMNSRLHRCSTWNAIRCECDHSSQFIERSMNLFFRHCWRFESIDCTFWESATTVVWLDTNDLSKNWSKIDHIWSLCFFARSYHEHDCMIFTCCWRSLMCNQICLCIKSSNDYCVQLVVETREQMTR